MSTQYQTRMRGKDGQPCSKLYSMVKSQAAAQLPVRRTRRRPINHSKAYRYVGLVDERSAI